MKASNLLREGCVWYRCYTMEAKEEDLKVENILVVCVFPFVFLEEFLGLPLSERLTLRFN